jgi:hypothetical protein
VVGFVHQNHPKQAAWGLRNVAMGGREDPHGADDDVGVPCGFDPVVSRGEAVFDDMNPWVGGVIRHHADASQDVLTAHRCRKLVSHETVGCRQQDRTICGNQQRHETKYRRLARATG